MTASAARRTAIEVVSKVRERRAFAHETLDAVLARHRDLDPRDRALATRIAYGVVATSGTLDEALDRFLERPSRVEPRVRDALQVAAWELLFGGAQPHVAVNEGVELVRSVRTQAVGLANAVLRKLAEMAPSFPWGDPQEDLSALARLHGHPLWMTELLVSDLGREAAGSVLSADNAPAPVYLAMLAPRERWDELVDHLRSEGTEPRPGPLVGSVEVGCPSALGRSLVLASEAAEVCDAAAQFAVHAMAPEPRMQIVDIGAGRGTKTLLLQARARANGGDAEIWAVDSHAFKLDVLVDRAAKAGVTGIKTVVADATSLPLGRGLPSEGEADAVLVDAPCSGLGTLRRHPDKRWRLEPSDIDRLAELAGRLVAESSRLVRPGGFVVYSTCTLTSRENRAVVEGFLGSEAGQTFSLESLVTVVPDPWRGFVAEEGWFQSVPAIGGPDGHFVARLRRR